MRPRSAGFVQLDKESEKAIKKVAKLLEDGGAWQEGEFDLDKVKKQVTEIEGTAPFWHMISLMIVQHNKLRKDLNEILNRVKELEEINENMRDSFRRKNEYGY